MKAFEEMTIEEKNAYFKELYQGLTPENKIKFRLKIAELLEEQHKGEKYFYLFDCLDGLIGDSYLTASDINRLITGAADPMPEKEIIKAAANYEATLYRYERTESGEMINETILYDCAF